MEVSIEMPLDADGFLRRECPACLRQFKWFHGDTEVTPEDWEDPDLYFCPYCGQAADHDSWWTQEQLDYAQAVALDIAQDEIANEFQRSMRRASSKHVKFDFKSGNSPRPAPIQETSDDMIMVEPPCHPFEPLKVFLDGEPLHCLVCGGDFTVADES